MGELRRPSIQYDGRDLVDSHGVHVPRRIVLHDTESHDYVGIQDIQGICQFWNRQNLGYGSHIIVDKEGKTGLAVSPGYIAWHVAGHNTGSLGIEQIGFAYFSNALWWTRQDQLKKVAKWIAWWGKKFDIPLVVDVEHGVSTHAMQSLAYGGSHTDPGKGYPLGYVMRLARKYYFEGW